MPLVQQIESSPHPQVRQVAAVYLREQIEEFYKKVPADIKPKLKTFLIQKLMSLSNRPERLAIGAAIASIAKYAFVDKTEGWTDLLIALEKISKPTENTELREVAYILWRNLVSFCGGALKKHFGVILEILKTGLRDEKSIKIQVESVRAIGIMVEFLENKQEVALIETFIPSMVAVIDKCLKKGDEENVIAGMEVFNDLVESKVPVISKHAAQLTAFNLKIAAAKDELPMTVRKQATNFATWLCKSKPKTVIQHGFIEPFITLCINLVIEDQEHKAKEEDEEMDEKTAFLSPLGIACDLLDEIFLNIPSEQCFPLAMKAIETLLSDSCANRRRTGYVLIAMMAEGCKEVIAQGDKLVMLLNACVKGMNDSDAMVRKCALEAITQLSTHCNFEILQHHKLLLPNIFAIFENENETIQVRERALSAIEYFIDAYDPNDSETTPSDNDGFQIMTYLQDIMGVIGRCLESNTHALRKVAISSLSSCATAAGSNFNIYLPKVIQLLESLMNKTPSPTETMDDDALDLRAEATSCLGAVASAVGFEAFKGVLPKFHPYVMDGLMNMDSSDIREASFMYFGELANIMGPNVLKLDSFEDMLNFVLFVMEDDDGLMVELPDDGFGDSIPKALVQAQNKFDEEEDEEDAMVRLTDEELQQLLADATAAPNDAPNDADDEEEADEDEDDDDVAAHVGQLRTIRLNVTTGFMEEKAAAVHALTAFIKNGGFEFLQHMDICWERLKYLWEYPHGLVKMAVSSCFHEFFGLIVNHSLHSNPQAIKVSDKGSVMFKYPYEANISIEYDSNVANWIETIFPLYIEAIRDEEDRDALNVIIDFFTEELKLLGPASLSNENMQHLIDALNLYLKEECQCQHTSDPRNNETKDIGTKHQWISDTIADLIATIAQLFGNKFEAIFSQLFANLLLFGRESRAAQDQAMVVGCIADCCSRLPANCPKIMSRFSDQIYQTALRIAAAQDVNMRQNALYCMGAMFTACDTQSNLKYSSQILKCIETYMQFDRDGERKVKLVRDNAVSALGKVLISQPNELPTKELLPVFIAALPLTCDATENQYVYPILAQFIVQHPSLIQPQMDKALTLLGAALSDKDVPQETTNQIANLFRKICQDQKIQNIIQNKVPQQPKENIFKALQTNQ
eukprot:72206_1